VYSEVEGKLDFGFEDRGEQQLKNISKPIRAFAVRAGAHSPLSERLSAAPPLPDKPSIAVESAVVIYLEVGYRGEILPGEQPAIIDKNWFRRK
jgi:hypothetical protein